MEASVEGSVIEVSAVEENAIAPIDVSPSGRLMVVKRVQSSNAYEPMVRDAYDEAANTTS